MTSEPLSPIDAAWSGLEPGCAEIAKFARTVDGANQLIFLSAATSLKRIADALCEPQDGSEPSYNILSLLGGIEMNMRNS